jgi:hypothetical protein
MNDRIKNGKAIKIDVMLAVPTSVMPVDQVEGSSSAYDIQCIVIHFICYTHIIHFLQMYQA